MSCQLSLWIYRSNGAVRENIEAQPTQLILSYTYSQKAIMSITIARYVKLFLKQAGIDLTVFSAHLTRSPSTSTRKNLRSTLDYIQKTEHWKANSTFRMHSKLPIHKNLGTKSSINTIIIVRYIAMVTYYDVIFLHFKIYVYR